MKFDDDRYATQPIHNKINIGDNMLFTVAEVAVILKTNVDYVHKLRKARLLPFIKLGSFKVRKEALEAFLQKYEGKDLTEPSNIKELDYGKN